MYFDEKLKNLREKMGLSLEEVAAKLDVSEAILEALETGFKDPDKIEMRKITEFYNVTEKELADDEAYVNAFSVLFQNSDMSESNLGSSLALAAGMFANQSRQNNTSEKSSSSKIIPIVKSVAIQERKPKFDYAENTISADLPNGEYIALHVNDDKMQGLGINKGDMAIVLLNAQIERNNLVAFLKNDEISIRRFIKKDNMVMLETTDSSCEPEKFCSEHFILGRVVEVKKYF